jgi:hypothetical protein
MVKIVKDPVEEGNRFDEHNPHDLESRVDELINEGKVTAREIYLALHTIHYRDDPLYVDLPARDFASDREREDYKVVVHTLAKYVEWMSETVQDDVHLGRLAEELSPNKYEELRTRFRDLSFAELTDSLPDSKAELRQAMRDALLDIAEEDSPQEKTSVPSYGRILSRQRPHDRDELQSYRA